MKKMILVPLSILLLAGCSSDNEPQSGTTTDPVEIKLTGGIQSITATTRGDGVISGTLPASELSISLARNNALNIDATTYQDYKNLSSSLAATISTAGAITITPTEYYLTNSYSTKLVGWYPSTGTFTEQTDAPATVTFALDGSTDVMLSNEVVGSKSSPSPAMTFAHLLTQIQIKAYAESPAAQTLWGNITAAIKIKSQEPTCTVTLPAAIDFSGTAADVPMSIVPNALSADSESPTDCGYAMIPPATASTQLQIEVTTATGGTITLNLPLQAYNASHAYTITLLFRSTNVTPSASMTDWTSETVGTPVEAQ
ncbi:fimbrillin family protein [uncultured Bacteroides sp.]|uniref:fimbrillin family protein n=1 Tax=uncultured Bacteroides sp. TaxID=162156 RepID=UPI002AA6C17B|nr:fimbrillin family protein [uncultured Bacteroides sp.]